MTALRDNVRVVWLGFFLPFMSFAILIGFAAWHWSNALFWQYPAFCAFLPSFLWRAQSSQAVPSAGSLWSGCNSARTRRTQALANLASKR